MEELTHVPWSSGVALLAMPVILLITALPPAQKHRLGAISARSRVRWGALLALLAAMIADACYLLGAREGLNLFQLPLPGLSFSLPFSIAVDGISMVLATLVAFVLLIIAQYSIQYLDGDPQQARFSRLLAFTGGFFLLVVIAGNIGLFTLAIFATGFGLHQLLQFYGDRPKAIMAAHKKSLFSRLADLLLLVATILVGQGLGTLQFSAIGQLMENARALPLSLQLAAWCIVGAVILKSAHFPFQGWLIQVMEAPTPVSALMHAGVVYSGAIIALRMSTLLVRVPDALLFVGFMGLLTVFLASLVMTTQTAVKSMLAWSTTAQLGFMSLELGLGLFPLALLHLVGHSLYKAHSFLSSGSVTDQLRQVPPGGKKAPGQSTWTLGIVLALLISGLGAWIFGENPLQSPLWMALVWIVAVAIAQILIKGFLFDSLRERVAAVGIAFAMGGIYYLLHELFVLGFSRYLAAFPNANGRAYLLLLACTAASFLLLSWLQGPGRSLLPQRLQLALYTHLYNGLYVDYWVDLFSHRFWSEKVGVEVPRRNLALESLEVLAQNQEVSNSTGGSQ